MEFKIMMLNLFIQAAGGLSLFIYGMNVMSLGLKKSAGNGIKNILGKISSNRVIGCLGGVVITAAVQSSSATTVILIGFVNAGVIKLQQAISIILGANIGTTMTAQLIAFKLSNIAMPAITIGIIIKLFIKNNKNNWGDIILGFGLIFFGMTIMKEALSPLKEYTSFFTAFSPNTFRGLLLSVITGAILTVLVQSSSATLGITMALASQGLIPFHAALALVLGENIGTTITAELATIGSNNINAIRTARAHTMFNIIGVSIILIIFPFFIKIVEFVTIYLGTEPLDVIYKSNDKTNISRYIANGHTLFNVLNSIIFLFFLKWLVKITKILSPGSKKNISHKKNTKKPFIIPMKNIRKEIFIVVSSLKKIFIISSSHFKTNTYYEYYEWEIIKNQTNKIKKVLIIHLVNSYIRKKNKKKSKTILNLIYIINNLEKMKNNIENISFSIGILTKLKKNNRLSLEEEVHSFFISILIFMNLILNQLKTNDKFNFITKATIVENSIDLIREKIKKKFIREIIPNSFIMKQKIIQLNIIKNLEKLGDLSLKTCHIIYKESKILS